MNKSDKIKKIEVDITKSKVRLDSEVPNKHKHRVKQFKDFLKNEIRLAQGKLDALRLEEK